MADAAPVPNRGPELLGVNIFFLVIVLTACLLRMYTRLFMVKAFGVDDGLMLLSTVFFVIYNTFSTVGVQFGTGHHHKDLEFLKVAAAMKCWFFCYIFYTCSMITSKVSIGYFLLRIAVKKVHQWTIYAAMAISVLAGLAFFFVTIFQCTPTNYFWDKYIPGVEGMCIPSDVIVGLAFLYSVFSVISDFTFALLPAFLLWDLKLKRRTKFAIIPLLAMGCIASSAVVARFAYLTRIREVDDFLWATLDIAIWSTVEQGLAITAGSLATLRPLFKILGYKLGLTTKPTSYGATAASGGFATHPQSAHMRSTARKASRAGLPGEDDDTDYHQSRFGGDAEAGFAVAGAKSEGGPGGIPLARVEVRITGGRKNHAPPRPDDDDGLGRMREKNESEEALHRTAASMAGADSFDGARKVTPKSFIRHRDDSV